MAPSNDRRREAPSYSNPTHRVVEPPLRFSCSLQGRPSCIPEPLRISKLSSAKAHGIRFEKALHKALPGSIYGQWWEFEDARGHGLCQTDLIYPFHLQPGPATIAVIEVKYTLVPGAHSKLSSLYIPVVQRATNCQVAGIVIVKNLDPRFRRGKIFTSLRPAVDAALDTGYPSLIQWSGQNLLHSPLPSLRSVDNAYHCVSQTD